MFRTIVKYPDSAVYEKDSVSTARAAPEVGKMLNRMVAMLAKEDFFPYAAPGSRSENLCQDLIRTGKQVFTFEDDSNQSLLAMGAKPIRVEELN